MNLVGNTIGNRYEVLEEAGIGGMATVYKAKDHVLNRDVAVKILKDEFTTDVDFIKRFNSEAQSAASLSHPNIVSIYDVGHEEEDNLYYIVMELIKGKTLKQIITKDEKLSWKWALNISIQIASALEVAHKNGIVHRDIKPHNIIITEDGVAKVMDFGIAKAVSNSTMTAFGTTIGSVHYFSPEQAKGSSTDARSDIYSLGVVMYEMLTGKVPFDADTPVSIALKHMQEEPKPAIEVNPNIPTAVNDIVMKAMRKEPDDRYQTATEMLADLSKALKDPEGDFVVLENEDGGYSRVIKGVNASDVKRSKSGAKSGKNAKKQNIFQKYPKLKIPAAILALVAIFFAVFGITKIAMDGFDSSVELPNLVGMTKEEAQKACDEKGLKFLIGEPIASNDIEKDKVAKQDPEFKDKKKVEKGTEIKVSISTGKEEHELPDWAGKTISEVEAEAEKFGLTINKIEEPSDKVEKGKVISTETKAGVIVVSGDTINVHVSTGKKKTKVPSLIGLTENQAKNMLTNAHLKAKVEYQTDESQADKKDCVIKQSEEQDSEVDEDTEITITINAIDDPKKAKFAITVNATYAGTQPTASAELTVMVNDKKAGKETVNFTATSKTKSFTVTTESDKAVKITVVDAKGNVVGGPKTSEDPQGWDEGVTIPESISVTIKDAEKAQ